MKNLAYILGVLTCAIILSSCDTRDDWFKDNCEEVVFYFLEGKNRKDTLDAHKPKTLDYTLKTKYVTSDGYVKTDTISLKVVCEMLGAKEYVPVNYSHYDGDGKPSNANVILNGVNFGKRRFDGASQLFGLGLVKDVQFFDSDTVAMRMGYVSYRVSLSDLLGNNYFVKININMIGNIPPIPVLEVSGNGLERRLSLKKSYDKDGSVKKYEVCVDGNAVEYAMDENRYEQIEGYWQGGKAAYGGTYITSTSINTFNHVFQELGSHTVFYRCMDNEGAWSRWKKETIIVE